MGLFLFRFYWKVLVDPVAQLGVAFVGVNNPYLTEEEVNATYRYLKNSSFNVANTTMIKNSLITLLV